MNTSGDFANIFHKGANLMSFPTHQAPYDRGSALKVVDPFQKGGKTFSIELPSLTV